MEKNIELEAQLKRAIRRHGVPGASLAVFRGKRVVAMAAAGVTNVNTQVPVTTDAVFQIGSITKVFTATLVMQLVDDGLLALDTPIIEYLPEFQVADAATRRAVTARHLLSHTSGIDGDFFADSGRGDDAIARLLQMGALLPSLFPLGEKMSYCNVGFAVLGRLVEVLRRETFDAAMRRRIFRPLGMNHAITLPEDVLRHRCAVGHVPDPKDPKRQLVAPRTYLSHGQKSAGSTPAMSASDLLKFVSAHLDQGRIARGTRLLSAASVAAMQRTRVQLPKYAPTGATAWGLGWILYARGGQKVLGHDGGTIGQYSFLRVSPKKRVAVALLTNGGDAMSVQQEMFGTLFDERIRAYEPVLPAVNAELALLHEHYLGRYENIQSTITIDARGGVLTASLTPKAEFGQRLEHQPIGFIDRHTARLQTGDPQLDRTRLLFSKPVDGRCPHVQVGLRQYRRVG